MNEDNKKKKEKKSNQQLAMHLYTLDDTIHAYASLSLYHIITNVTLVCVCVCVGGIDQRW